MTIKKTPTERVKGLIEKIITQKKLHNTIDVSKWLSKGKNPNYLNGYLKQQTKNLWPFIDRLIEDKEDLNVYFDNPILIDRESKEVELLREELKRTREQLIILERELEYAKKMIAEKQVEFSELHKSNLQLMLDQNKLTQQVLSIVNNLKPIK